MKEEPSPCYFCTEHRAGCHVPECEHGWWEWHENHLQRVAEIAKQKKLEDDLHGSAGRKRKPKASPAARAFRKQYRENGGAHE